MATTEREEGGRERETERERERGGGVKENLFLPQKRLIVTGRKREVRTRFSDDSFFDRYASHLTVKRILGVGEILGAQKPKLYTYV